MIKSDSKIIPRPGILSAPLYVGGKSKIDNIKQPIKLSANENPYGPSPKAVSAFTSVKNSLALYPDSGHLILRRAIAEIYGLDENRVICGAGSDEIIHFLCQCYAGIGDEVIHTEYGFAMYKISALTMGATPVAVKEVQRRADISNIINASNEKTKLIFLANPNNPTGTMLSAEEIELLADSIPKHTLLVLDGAYAEYIENFDAGVKLLETKRNIFITRTFSKIYGLGALRVGWGYGSEPIIDALRRVKGPFNISSAAQEAAKAAILDIDYVKRCRDYNYMLREKLALNLQRINIPSDQSFGNFILARFSDKDTALSADRFLLENGLIVRNVTNYGLKSALRITVGTSSDCEKVVHTLTNFQENMNAI
jgi:histidinol-phosphate aminotransferase